MKKVRVAIIGASGYTGVEAIEILLRHPSAKATYLTALPEECGPVGDLRAAAGPAGYEDRAAGPGETGGSGGCGAVLSAA